EIGGRAALHRLEVGPDRVPLAFRPVAGLAGAIEDVTATGRNALEVEDILMRLDHRGAVRARRLRDELSSALAQRAADAAHELVAPSRLEVRDRQLLPF